MTVVTTNLNPRKNFYTSGNHPKDNGYDIRIVRYEDIHNITEDQFYKLSRAVSPKNGDLILDAGCGYGAVSREIIRQTPISGGLKFHLLDKSSVQIARARKEKFPSSAHSMEFIQGDILEHTLDNKKYDKIVSKMMLHEIPSNFQLDALKRLFNLLKPGGKLIIWENKLDDASEVFFKAVIGKKDELAGFHTLKKNRNFLTKKQLFNLLEKAGFSNIKEEYELDYRLATGKRLDPEFKGDPIKLQKWNKFIRYALKSYKPEFLKKLRLYQSTENLIFSTKKAIYTAIKF